MPFDTSFSPRLGTVLATFAQNGTYSAVAQLNGRLVGLYADPADFARGAAGSITFRASASPTGTGHPVQTNDGTALRVLAFATGIFYQFGEDRFTTIGLGPFVRLQMGTDGTATAAAGGTVVLVTQAGS